MGGAEITKNDLLVVDQAFYEWQEDGSGQELTSSYGSEERDFVSVSEFVDILPGAQGVFAGNPVGSRIVVMFSAEDLESASTHSTPSGTETSASGMVVYDVYHRYPARTTVDSAQREQSFDSGDDLPRVTAFDNKKPRVSVPGGDPPADLDVRTLIEGEGDRITQGDTIVAQYLGVMWSSGKEFDSPWEYDAVPKDFSMTRDSVIRGWSEGLSGQRSGSRVLLTIPPELAYGESGNDAVNIPPDETLVYVVDILDVHAAP